MPGDIFLLEEQKNHGTIYARKQHVPNLKTTLIDSNQLESLHAFGLIVYAFVCVCGHVCVGVWMYVCVCRLLFCKPSHKATLYKDYIGLADYA